MTSGSVIDAIDMRAGHCACGEVEALSFVADFTGVAQWLCRGCHVNLLERQDLSLRESARRYSDQVDILREQQGTLLLEIKAQREAQQIVTRRNRKLRSALRKACRIAQRHHLTRADAKSIVELRRLAEDA